MNMSSMNNLITDGDFIRMIARLNTEQYNDLEHKISYDGFQPTITTWRKIIISGLDEYEICQRLKMPFHHQEKAFYSRDEAILFICNSTIKSGHASEMLQKYCIGRMYEAQKRLIADPAYPPNHSLHNTPDNPHQNHSRYIIVKRLEDCKKLSHAQVYSYGIYANALDEIYHKAPEIADALISGELDISINLTIEMQKLSANNLRKVIAHYKNHHKKHILRLETKELSNHGKPVFSGRSKSIKPEIKQMPKYDPDAEISSLALTIPMWVSSMRRTCSNANFNEASTCAISALLTQLTNLSETIQILRKALREETHE